jgi:glycosyltransferase involved in cell wall biosynthesis
MKAISVIIVTRNREELVVRAINSALIQSCPALEIIVVVNGSDDATAKIIRERFADRIKISVLPKNIGLSAARNYALKIARGELVAFLDDDDSWRPKKLEKQGELMDKLDDSYSLVYTWSLVHKHGEVKTLLDPKLEGQIFKHTILNQPLTNSSTWLVRKERLLAVGGFDNDIWRGVDGDMIRRLSLVSKVSYVPEILVDYYENHHFSRITSSAGEGRNLALIGEMKKIEKYSSEIDKYPVQRAELFLKIAALNRISTNHLDALGFLFKSIPYSLFRTRFWKELIILLLLIFFKKLK